MSDNSIDLGSDGCTTPKATTPPKVSRGSPPSINLHQVNLMLNDPANAPVGHHILPDAFCYYPNWVRDWVSDGNGSIDMCRPIGMGNSLGITESARHNEIKRLFEEAQAGVVDNMGAIRAHRLNQLLLGSLYAPLPIAGSYPYYQALDYDEFSFTVPKPRKKRSKSMTSAKKQVTPAAAQSPFPPRRIARHHSISALPHFSTPSRYSPSRPAPPPPNKGKKAATSITTTSTELPLRIAPASSFEVYAAMRKSSPSTTSTTERPRAGRRAARSAEASASNRRPLERSQAHSQLLVNEHDSAPNQSDDDDEEEVVLPPANPNWPETDFTDFVSDDDE